MERRFVQSDYMAMLYLGYDAKSALYDEAKRRGISMSKLCREIIREKLILQSKKQAESV